MVENEVRNSRFSNLIQSCRHRDEFIATETEDELLIVDGEFPNKVLLEIDKKTRDLQFTLA